MASVARVDELRVFGTLADVASEPASQDPLGFGQSAEWLADVFAPGLTVSTRHLRYYQVLACGVKLAAGIREDDARGVALRLERVWALASYLSDRVRGDQPNSGLAGIRSVREAAAPHRGRQPVDYPMFQRNGQARLGVLGLYRRSAEQLGFVDGDTPTTLGDMLASSMERALDAAGLHGATVGKYKTAGTSALVSFGAKAGLFTDADRQTAQAAWDALRVEPNRRLAAKTIRTARYDQNDLLDRLVQVKQFAAAARAVQAFEDAFAVLTRLFDATLILANDGRAVNPTEIRSSPTLVDTLRRWKRVAAAQSTRMERGHVDLALVELGLAVSDAPDPWEAVLLLVRRHHEVQEAKARSPWLRTSGAHLIRTAAASPGLNYSPFDPNQAPGGHDFRLRNLRQLAREIHHAGVTLT
jgi:hypothetical protein